MKTRFGALALGALLTSLSACSSAPVVTLRSDDAGPTDTEPVYIPPDGGDGDPNGDYTDPVESAFGIGKADGACLSSVTSDDARGLLALANDASVSAADLDSIGLSTKTANAIASARPYADLAALDAVPTVGPYACNTLRKNACDVRGLCERELPLWTWNIESFPLSATAVDQVATTLDGEGVELVGFEEVDSLTAFDDLLSKLPGWAGIEGQYGYGTRVAVAYRAERLHPTSTEHLFPNDSYRFPRPPLAVRFEIDGRIGVASFTLVVVHLKAQIDADSQERRRQAIVLLEQWVNQKRTAGDSAIIVVGDFNDDIDDPPAYNVFQPFLTRPDSYVPLTLPAAQRGEFSYIPFQRLIDHMVGTREAADSFVPLAVETVPLDQSIPNYVNVVSDHRPVRSRLVPIIPATR